MDENHKTDILGAIYTIGNIYYDCGIQGKAMLGRIRDHLWTEFFGE